MSTSNLPDRWRPPHMRIDQFDTALKQACLINASFNLPPRPYKKARVLCVHFERERDESIGRDYYIHWRQYAHSHTKDKPSMRDKGMLATLELKAQVTASEISWSRLWLRCCIIHDQRR
ncbi:unnamed protein product [Fusarium fujikuroi]|nr:unnamed protein product [Fusarium fujikuroi]VZI07797.1 unnamed protein product [Fusarium fujikuroi]